MSLVIIKSSDLKIINKIQLSKNQYNDLNKISNMTYNIFNRLHTAITNDNKFTIRSFEVVSNLITKSIILV